MAEKKVNPIFQLIQLIIVIIIGTLIIEQFVKYFSDLNLIVVDDVDNFFVSFTAINIIFTLFAFRKLKYPRYYYLIILIGAIFVSWILYLLPLSLTYLLLIGWIVFIFVYKIDNIIKTQNKSNKNLFDKTDIHMFFVFCLLITSVFNGFMVWVEWFAGNYVTSFNNMTYQNTNIPGNNIMVLNYQNGTIDVTEFYMDTVISVDDLQGNYFSYLYLPQSHYSFQIYPKVNYTFNYNSISIKCEGFDAKTIRTETTSYYTEDLTVQLESITFSINSSSNLPVKGTYTLTKSNYKTFYNSTSMPFLHKVAYSLIIHSITFSANFKVSSIFGPMYSYNQLRWSNLERQNTFTNEFAFFKCYGMMTIGYYIGIIILDMFFIQIHQRDQVKDTNKKVRKEEQEKKAVPLISTPITNGELMELKRISLEVKNIYPQSETLPFNEINLSLLRIDQIEKIKRFIDLVNKMPNLEIPKYGSMELFRRFGRILDKLSMQKSAEIAYMLSIMCGSTSPDVYNNLGLIELKAGHFSDAELLFKKAIDFNNKNASYWNNLGLTYMQLSKYNDAEKSFKSAIEIIPENIDFWQNLCNCLKKQDKNAEYEEANKKLDALRSGTLHEFFLP